MWISRYCRLHAFAACLIIVVVLGEVNCGSGSQKSGSKEPDITIIGQPTNQSAPLGQTATLSVSARGGSSLSYQWNRNGKMITGATSDTYVTAPLASADNGASFTVTISDASGTVTSNVATLSIGPRSPRMGDLRFKGVDFASTLPFSGAGSVIGLETTTVQNSFGSPLEVGAGVCGSGNQPSECAWNVRWYQVSSNMGISTIYVSDILSNLGASISAANRSNVVITSLDERPSNNTFAIAYVQTAQTAGFDAVRNTVQSQNLQSSISSDGMLGRVVTAVSTNSTGQIDYISCGWQSDSQTYEAVAIFATQTDVEFQASVLAEHGYLITAVGSGGAQDGFILVGTRAQGDSLSRAFALNQGFENGYAIIGAVFDSNGNTFFGEK